MTDRWKDEIHRRTRKSRRRKKRARERVDAKIDRIVRKAQKDLRPRQANKISSQLERLARIVEGADSDLDVIEHVEQELTRLRREAKQMSLEEAEQEADEVYGDQSENRSYYFDRKPPQREAAVRDDMDLDEAEEEADETYGDQSDNDTYYGLS